MNDPSVSILMAVRNEERYLAAALNSLLRQTLTDWELVVVDDGSTDNTPQILADFSGKDDRIQPVYQPADGLVPALVLGTENCRAALVARMDGDDICHPRRLEKQFNFMATNSDVDLVACNFRYFPSHIVQGGMRYYEQWQNSLHNHDEIMRNFFVESPFVQPSVMYRREVADKVGGYRDMGWSEDYDLWLRMAENGCRFARLPGTLFFWREHPDRLTHTGNQCSLDAFRRCRAHFLKRDYLSDDNEVTLWGAGMEGKEWRKVLLDLDIRVKRWIDVDPNKIGQTIHNAKVDAPDDLKSGCGPMLITIGARGARDLVRAKCNDLGLIENKDYICVT